MSALVEKALVDIWGQPAQDYSKVIKPARITAPGGAFKQFTYFNRRVPLPNYGVENDRSYFHVFEVGAIALSVLSLPDQIKSQWTPVTELCNQEEQVIDIVLETGALVPRNLAFIGQSQEGSLFIAIRHDNRVDYGQVLRFDALGQTYRHVPAGVGNLDISVRFYDAAIKTSSGWAGAHTNPVNMIYAKINSLNDYTNFMATANAADVTANTVGLSLWFVDGFLENKPTGFENRFVGKYLGFYADQTYVRFDWLEFNQLPMFTSQVDFGRAKYIAALLGNGQEQVYRDDVDFYLVSKNGSTFKGVMLNRSRLSTVRMLTHDTFSITSQVVDFQRSSQPFLNDNTFFLLCCVRQGGMNNQLVYERSRLSELYLLPRASRLAAMSGTFGSPAVWRASSLEQSDYVKVMDAYSPDQITEALAASTYGYYASLFLVNQPFTPVNDVSGGKQLVVPEAQRFVFTGNGATNRAIFLYDINGLFLEAFEDHQVGTTLVTVNNAQAAFAECFMKQISANETGALYNQNVSSFDLKEFGYRCYVSTLDGNDDPVGDWEDVTDGNLFAYSDGPIPSITWNFTQLSQSGLYPAVLIPSKILFYAVDLTGLTDSGYLRFNVGADQPVGNTTQFAPQTLALGHVDVFMNGESLIPDIDYFMNWPEICVVKRPDTNIANTVLFVRAYSARGAFENEPFKTQKVGFAKDGLLGVNQQYDLIQGRAKRVLVNRRLVNPDSVRYADVSGGMVVPDGSSYLIQDYELSVETFSPIDTLTLRQLDIDGDAPVANYLRSRLPEPVSINPSIEGDVLDLYSPFLSAVIFAFNDGFLGNGELDQLYDNTQVEAWIAPFKPLLDYDPCLRDLDFRYISVFPHIETGVIDVTPAQYGFLSYLAFHYLASRVNLSLMLSIVE